MHCFCEKCGGEIFPGQSCRRGRRGRVCHLSPPCAAAAASRQPAPLRWDISEGGELRMRRRFAQEREISRRVACSQVTRECYDCDACKDDPTGENRHLSAIYPGSLYERIVLKFRNGEYWENSFAIEIQFRHYPQCPYPPEPVHAGTMLKLVPKKKRTAAPCRPALVPAAA